MKLNSKKINYKLNADFSKIKKNIDFESFNNQVRKTNVLKIVFKTGLCLAGCVVLCIVMIPVFAMMKINERSIRRNRVTYSESQITKIKESSIKALNSVTYPNAFNEGQTFAVDKEYANAMNTFANALSSKIKLNEENVVYSPLSLYATLDIASLLSNDEETNLAIDNLLAMNKENRSKNYTNMFKNNFFIADKGTTQMYNGLFVEGKYKFNSDLIKPLTDHYVETFQINYQKEDDVSFISHWIDRKVNGNDFIRKEDLAIDEETVMTLVSTLYFKQEWSTMFNKKKSYKDEFYGNQRTSKTTFMTHSFYNNVYDYGDYITVEDFYAKKYKIKYIVSKEMDRSIYQLIQGNNIFEDDETKIIKPENPEAYGDGLMIHLSLPKFEANYFQDFSSSLKELGLKKIFDENGRSFNYSFKNLSVEDSIYMKYVKQRNTISFDEDGTTAKTVTFAGFDGKSASYVSLDTMEIKLNQPFIYIIKDENNLPLYVGTLNNL